MEAMEKQKRNLLVSPDLEREMSGEEERGLKQPLIRIPGKTHLAAVLLNSNPWEQRDLDKKLKEITREQIQRQRALHWAQRRFFIEQVFDPELNLRFAKLDQERESQQKEPQKQSTVVRDNDRGLGQSQEPPRIQRLLGEPSRGVSSSGTGTDSDSIFQGRFKFGNDCRTPNQRVISATEEARSPWKDSTEGYRTEESNFPGPEDVNYFSVPQLTRKPSLGIFATPLIESQRKRNKKTNINRKNKNKAATKINSDTERLIIRTPFTKSDTIEVSELRARTPSTKTESARERRAITPGTNLNTGTPGTSLNTGTPGTSLNTVEGLTNRRAGTPLTKRDSLEIISSKRTPPRVYVQGELDTPPPGGFHSRKQFGDFLDVPRAILLSPSSTFVTSSDIPPGSPSRLSLARQEAGEEQQEAGGDSPDSPQLCLCDEQIIMNLTRTLPSSMMLKANAKLNAVISERKQSLMDHARQGSTQDTFTDPRWHNLRAILVPPPEEHKVGKS